MTPRTSEKTRAPAAGPPSPNEPGADAKRSQWALGYPGRGGGHRQPWGRFPRTNPMGPCGDWVGCRAAGARGTASPNELSCRCAAPAPMKTGSGAVSWGRASGRGDRPVCVWSSEAVNELGRGRHAPAPGAPGDGEPEWETVGGAEAPTAPAGQTRRGPAWRAPTVVRRPRGRRKPRLVSTPVRGPGGCSRRGPEEFSWEPKPFLTNSEVSP